MLNIGKLQVNSNFLLAPMSGVTDYPYREIVKKFKPGLVFSEMIASRALLAQNSKTMKMIKKTDNYLSAVQEKTWLNLVVDQYPDGFSILLKY